MKENLYQARELFSCYRSVHRAVLLGGKDVVEKINIEFTKPEQYYTDKGNGKYMVDLWKLNKNQLMEAGIHPQNVELSKICTKCNRDIFFPIGATKVIQGVWLLY